MDWLKISLYDNASPSMENLTIFHDYAMFIIIMILSCVSFCMMMMMTNSITSNMIMENQLIEIIWTLIPTLTLTFIALPSLHILYLMDELNSPSLTLKIIGHQWYWSYEYSDFSNIEFDSYMINNPNFFRLLEVDNNTPLPINCQTRLIISSLDVIHSWTIPAMGIKSDATPGRLNQNSLMSNRMGTFYGQCSEICGSNHSFMPIVVDIINTNSFIKWINNFN